MPRIFPRRKEKCNDPFHQNSPTLTGGSIFYVNVTILDASVAVYEKVYERVGNIPLKKHVAQKISGIVSDGVVTKRLARKLPKLLMYVLGQKGLRLHAETVFVQDTYLVLELRLLNANPVALAQSAAEDAAAERLKQALIEECKASGIYDENREHTEDDCSIATQVLDDWLEHQAHSNEYQQANYSVTSRLDAVSTPILTRTSFLARVVRCILDFILSARNRRRLESEYLPNLIHSIVARKMDNILRQKLQDKQVHAETVVLTEQFQAQYFFGQLRFLNNRPHRQKRA